MPIRDRLGDRAQVRVEVVDARLVVDDAVLAGAHAVGAARLGDVDRRDRRAVAGAHRDQPLAQGVGDDRPAEVGGRVAHDRHLLEGQIGVLGRGRDLHRVVVVDAVEVERLADQRKVAGLDELVHERRQVDRVAAEQHRLEVERVPQLVEELGGAHVGVVVAGRPHRRVVVGAADALDTCLAQGDRRPAMGEQQVVGHRKRVEEQLVPGRVDAAGVAQHGDDVRLVDRDPVLDPVAEPSGHDPGELPEDACHVAVQPAAAVLQLLREVPVVERDHRLDAGLAQLVDEPVVEVQARPG